MSVILTAAEMRAAEQRVIEGGTSAETLMDRAGTAAAEAIWRYAGPMPTLILCGPGNNGGDGYVIARLLAERGVDVRVAALAEPQTRTARWARSGWSGPVEDLRPARGAALLVDALLGTGLTRPLDAASILQRLAAEAAVRVAIDLPSGVATDDGRILSPVPDYDLTITFAAKKPSHLLQPAARHMGRIVVADIGVPAEGCLSVVRRPRLRRPAPNDHKYSRGYVAVVAGEMPGAAALAASAAARGAAGYVRLITPAAIAGVPQAIVQSQSEACELLSDRRIGCLAIGPGLGRGAEGRALLQRALASDHPLVLDADALFLVAGSDFHQAMHMPILTPHAGEFERLSAILPRTGRAVEGDPSPITKLDQTRAAAAALGAIIVHKGPDTVIAAPDGRAAIAPPAPAWLATAGTGDVLTGIIATMRAQGLEPFEAACAGVWLHSRAAALAGPALVADDLLAHLPAAVAECL